MMNFIGMKKTLFIMAAMVFALAGCGGAAPGAGTSTGTDTGGSSSSLEVSGMVIVDSDGNNQLSPGASAIVSVTVKSGGSPLANQVVSFALDSAGATLATLNPTSGTALTNSSGVANIQLLAAAITSGGAGNVTASVSSGSTTASSSAAFSVGSASLTLSGMTSSAGNSLPSGGTTTISVNLSITTTPIQVSFSSQCAAASTAQIDSVATSISGVASVTYKANSGCLSDIVTAQVSGSTPRTLALTIAAPTATNLLFQSAAPNLISFDTPGAGLATSSIVTFRVVDATNTAVGGQTVTFDLSTRTGGVRFGGQTPGDTDTVSAISGADGLVSINVLAGTLPTSVEVIATLGTITSRSNRLVISTGVPSQDRFSLSATTLNIEGLNRDNETTTINILAADRLGNFVPDGTTINFISEGASISSTCTTTGGSCSVQFRSQENRPRLVNMLNPNADTLNYGPGRVTVTAYALGEESFTDSNGNNIYNSGEAYTNLGNVFVDRQENGVWDANFGGDVSQADQEIPFIPEGGGATGSLSCTTSPVRTDVPYAPSKANTCDNKWGKAHVRRDLTIILSGSTAYISETPIGANQDAAPTTTSIDPNDYEFCAAGEGRTSNTYTYYLADVNGNPMPAGTTISLIGTNITATLLGGSPVINTTSLGGTLFNFSLEIDDCGDAKDGSVTIRVTTPRGVTTGQTIRTDV